MISEQPLLCTDPALLTQLLDVLADQIAEYAIYQASSGADFVMLFDSWAAQLPPKVRRCRNIYIYIYIRFGWKH